MKSKAGLFILASVTMSMFLTEGAFGAPAAVPAVKPVVAPAIAAKVLPLPLAAQPMPAPTPIDWDHLPEGALPDLLTVKEELSPADAATMSQAIVTVAAQMKVPEFIIYAAVKQESDFEPYGVLYDYGNYSCSIAQFSIAIWCQTFSKTAADRLSVGWPKGVSCDDVAALNDNIMYPLYMAANAKTTVQDHGTTDADFLSLDAKTLIPKMPGTHAAQQAQFYQAAISFGSQCNHTQSALKVMAHTLADIHDNEVPSALKKAHPNMAWLLSDGVYNMGDAAIDLMTDYGGKDIWKNLTPQLYVDTIAKILKAKPAADKVLTYKDSNGGQSQVGYFQMCVSQRHVTSITNAGLPNGMPDVVKSFVDDCEGLYPTAP